MLDPVVQLRWEDVDMDNLLMTLMGKGAKQRKVPFSFDHRKLLFKLPNNGKGFVFAPGCTITNWGATSCSGT